MLPSEDPFSSHIDLTLHTQIAAWIDFLPDVEKTTQNVIVETLKAIDFQNRYLQISVVLADDDFIQVYNKQYRGKDSPTNVLSFSALHENFVLKDGDNLGDIIISFSTVEKEALDQHKTFENHYIHLLIHGMLHLFGYDHSDELEAQEMETLEIKVLSKFGISDPYSLST